MVCGQQSSCPPVEVSRALWLPQLASPSLLTSGSPQLVSSLPCLGQEHVGWICLQQRKLHPLVLPLMGSCDVGVESFLPPVCKQEAGPRRHFL